jgi:hypothetical protein
VTATDPVILGNLASCPSCGDPLDKSAITDSVFYGSGSTLAYFGGEGHLHLHGVALVAGGMEALGVRAALRRLADRKRTVLRRFLRLAVST